MFWCEHSYVAYSTTYVGYSTLRRKSAFLCRKTISCCGGGCCCRAAGRSYEACITALPAVGRGADAAGGVATCRAPNDQAAEQAEPTEEGSARVEPGLETFFENRCK